ncbi:MAG: hypothetical protein R3E94_05050 [Burkholderiaceae bacterium]
MRRSQLVHATIALTVATSWGLPARANDVAFEVALQNYEDCRWQLAFDGLSRQADQGHGDAARIANLMVRYGRTLYGQAFAASEAQMQRWRAIAVATPQHAR